MSRRRRQGAANCVEQHLYLRAFSAFRIRNPGLWGIPSVVAVVIAIPAHTQDDADSLSLRSFYGKN